MSVQIQRTMSDMDDSTVYMFEKLFTAEELAQGKWFLTVSYDRDMIESVVEDLSGKDARTLVRSHPDTADMFFYAVVPNIG